MDTWKMKVFLTLRQRGVYARLRQRGYVSFKEEYHYVRTQLE
jgi:hypothetical protein